MTWQEQWSSPSGQASRAMSKPKCCSAQHRQAGTSQRPSSQRYSRGIMSPFRLLHGHLTRGERNLNSSQSLDLPR